MLARLQEIKDSLSPTVLNLDKCPKTLNSEKWALISDYVNLLKPLEIMTAEVSGEKYPTMSIIIPLIPGLQLAIKSVSTITVSGLLLQKTLMDTITQRLSGFETNKISSKATFLDPRFKKYAFGNEDNANGAQNWITEELKNLINLEKLDDNNKTKIRSLQPGEGDRYECCRCFKSWSTIEEACTHICEADSTIYVKCRNCFQNVIRHEFDHHLNSHEPTSRSVETLVKPFTCQICFQVFQREAAFNAHMKISTKAHSRKRNKNDNNKTTIRSLQPGEGDRYECCRCFKSWSTIEKACTHICEADSTIYVKCRNCFQNVLRHEFDHHLNSHEPTSRSAETHVKPFTCQVCFQVFQREAAFNAHMKISTKAHSRKSNKNDNNKTKIRSLQPGEGDRYECCRCFKSWSTIEEACTHICEADSTIYVKCRNCFQNVIRHEFDHHLNSHEPTSRSVETLVKPFTCQICFQVFQREAAFNAHMKISTKAHSRKRNKNDNNKTTIRSLQPGEGDRYECCRCFKSWSTIEKACTHICEADSTIYVKCRNCFQNVLRHEFDHHLNSHEPTSRSAETHVKPFTCQVCFQVFQREAAFNAHMKISTKAHSRKSNKNDNNKTTIRSLQPGEGDRYECCRCFKSWSTIEKACTHICEADSTIYVKCRNCFQNVLRHEFDHHLNSHEPTSRSAETHVKPFTCQVCFQVFQREAAFNAHMKISTKAHSRKSNKNDNNKTTNRSLQPGEGDRYECCRCFKSWSTIEEACTHICEADSTIYVKCRNCFQNVIRHEFDHHLNSHEPTSRSVETLVKPFTCQICFQVFQREAAFNAHMKISTKAHSRKRNKNDNNKTTIRSLQPGEGDRYECCRCFKSWSTIEEACTHICEADSTIYVKCRNCFQNVIRHEFDHHLNSHEPTSRSVETLMTIIKRQLEVCNQERETDMNVAVALNHGLQ
ncbi:unnamed protein product [Diabrotica balteata]|uniref:C2H2-type domain-containing protein n=1 Tax=Diabrotica balteata TaxID=107213 RepID=A0A9N9XI03_DIABA|nr:unnamed protein product [Diabrotica balteata]